MFTATPNREKLLLPICHQALMKGRSPTTCSAETGATETLVALLGNVESRLARRRYQRRRRVLLFLALDRAHLSFLFRPAAFTSCCSAKTRSVLTVTERFIVYLCKMPANLFFFKFVYIDILCVCFFYLKCFLLSNILSRHDRK